MKLMRILFFILALIVGLGAFLFLAPKDEAFGLFSSGNGVRSFDYVYAYLATVIGVFLGSFYRGLSALRISGTRRVPSGFAAARLRSVDLWLGLVASPIVFVFLLRTTDGMSLPGLIIVGLENGFCELVVIESLMQRKESEKT